MSEMHAVAGATRRDRGPGLTERVAAEVRALRGRHSVSQAELGRILGLSQPQVSARLRGRTPFTLSAVVRAVLDAHRECTGRSA